MQTRIQRVEAALEKLKQGKMIILTDDPRRENEGDLVAVAETMNQEQMNQMIQHTSGIVCISMLAEQLNKFNLPLMVPSHLNSSSRGTPFTLSVDAKHGISTGVSAADRIVTVHTLVNDQSTADDFVKPGHVFPLQAKEGGVLERQGHTEGAMDLVRMAGFKPAAVLCELMNADGTMAKGKQLDEYAQKHELVMLSIDDIITYRLQTENLISATTSVQIPLEKYGTFELTVIKEKFKDQEHVVLYKENKNLQKPPLVRIHSSCLTGDLFASERCDCHRQLHHALECISVEGGILIYLNQEGRGIGLFNKIKAYQLQDQGYDTVEANTQLGLPIDARNYYLAANILHHYGINQIRLLTNNPNKIADLIKCGINYVDREPMPAFIRDHNHFYLQTKKEKLKHAINFD